MRFVPLQSGARIAWTRSGAGPTLVRVPCWITNVESDSRSLLEAPFFAKMESHMRVVRYDRRGCGSSSPDDQPVDLLAAVEELSAVIDACAEPKVTLLGQAGSVGTAVAYAALNPDRVNQLILVGGFLEGGLKTATTQDQQSFDALIKLIQLKWSAPSSAVQQYLTANVLPSISPAVAHVFNEQQRVCCNGERAANLMRARRTLDITAYVSQIKCPTAVLHSARDLLVNVERGRALAAAIPGATFEVLPTSNSAPWYGEAAFDPFCESVIRSVTRKRDEDIALTPRERELAHAIAMGLDNKDAAQRLSLSEKTVRNSLTSIYAKLGVQGRSQAIIFLRDRGFGALTS